MEQKQRTRLETKGINALNLERPATSCFQGVASVEAKDVDMSDANNTNLASIPLEAFDKEEVVRKKAGMAN
eukprot:3231269-Karenia_brevis.AAC.1